MTTLELKDTDGAFIVSEDGSCEMHLPDLADETLIPPYLYIIFIMAMMVKDKEFLEKKMDEFLALTKDLQVTQSGPSE